MHPVDSDSCIGLLTVRMRFPLAAPSPPWSRRKCAYCTFQNLAYVTNLHFPVQQVQVAVHEWYH